MCLLPHLLLALLLTNLPHGHECLPGARSRIQSLNDIRPTSGSIPGGTQWCHCAACSAALTALHFYPYKSTAELVFTELCPFITGQNRPVCAGIAALFGEPLVWIVANSNLTTVEMCGLWLDESCRDTWSLPAFGDWIGSVLLPVGVQLERMLQEPPPAPAGNHSTILHLSDLHLDRFYHVGSPSHCGEPHCCRATSTPTSLSTQAGPWGSMGKCDTPLRTVEGLLKHVSQLPRATYQYVILTGDSIPHDTWNTSKGDIVNTTRLLSALYRKWIPRDRVVVPVVGNHEAIPVNMFVPDTLNVPHFSTRWLYTELLSQWSQWIPTSQHALFTRLGYYSKPVGNGIRFIALNMNYCARLNLWLAYRPTDLGDMLRWLQFELSNATLKGEKVYLVGHTPPDLVECTSEWIRTYLAIITRYQHVIRGQFFGHRHFDELRLYYPPGYTTPVGVAYLAPSVTTYLDVQPAFRLYATDPATGQVTDHSTFYMDVSEANSNGPNVEPKWRFEYSARDAYALPALDASTWHVFFERALGNASLAAGYLQFRARLPKVALGEKTSFETKARQAFARIPVRV